MRGRPKRRGVEPRTLVNRAAGRIRMAIYDLESAIRTDNEAGISNIALEDRVEQLCDIYEALGGEEKREEVGW